MTDALTPRQREVARLVTMARTNKEIAAELGLSMTRVEALVTAIAARWHLVRGNTRVQIARRYLVEYDAPDDASDRVA